MIDYLTHPKFLYYDPTVLPSVQGGGGGMGTKTHRTLEALREVFPKTTGIYNSSDIAADTVLIEPLRFTLPLRGFADRDYENTEQLIAGLKEYRGKKILYCSELTLMRMPHRFRKRILALCDAVTANCKFQANVFKYVGVHASHILCDPLPDAFLPKLKYSDRQPRLVATGNVSWQKNAPQVIEVFKALKGVVERVYVGSASLWYDASTEDVPQRLQNELYENTDRVVREATTPQIAEEFHNARFGLWVAFHDTFATAAQEMIMAGMPVAAAKHGLASEIPVRSAIGVRAQVEAIKHLSSQSDTELEAQSKRLTQWARENVSYEAFKRQLNEVLRTI